jgi:hypothetical protein
VGKTLNSYWKAGIAAGFLFCIKLLLCYYDKSFDQIRLSLNEVSHAHSLRAGTSQSDGQVRFYGSLS